MQADSSQIAPTAVNAGTGSKTTRLAPLFGQAELQLNDFQHAVRHDPGTLRLVKLGNAGAGVAAAMTAVLALQSKLPWAAASGLLALGCLAVHQLPDAMALSWYRKTSAPNRKLRFTLNGQGVIVVSESSSRLYAWRQLYWAAPTTRSWLVWVSPRHFLILPCRAFDTAERDLVSETLAARLPLPPNEPLPWRRWTSLAALALLAWLAWETLVPR